MRQVNFCGMAQIKATENQMSTSQDRDVQTNTILGPKNSVPLSYQLHNVLNKVLEIAYITFLFQLYLICFWKGSGGRIERESVYSLNSGGEGTV